MRTAATVPLLESAGKMVDISTTILLIGFITLWNIHSFKTQICGLDHISEEIEGFSKPLVSGASNFSSNDGLSPPREMQSHAKRSLTPLQIKSMSKMKTLSVPSKRKRRLAPLIPPILPPLIPPIIPPLPLLPLPLLPLIPPPIITLVPKIINPIKSLQKLKRKTDFEKTLKSIGKSKPIKLPGLDAKKNILDKLLDLKRKGSLTTAEFIRFKKLLLQ